MLQKRDALALLPTGGGKSVCYQVPALMQDGICIVISPLIALMKDQVEQLQKKEIPALALHSGLTFYDIKKTLQNAAHGNFKFLYLSPERLETNLFKEYLPLLRVNLIAVDEAHCISQWGYDFRPPYLRIAALREELPGVPVLALTASATPQVQDDIIAKLQFKHYQIFRQGFERANLSYSVFNAESKVNKMLDVLHNVPGSSIIYCRNRRLTKEITQLLRMNNIAADFYHAGLPKDERSKKQDDWMNNIIRVMICTNAFGMGIDKPDVRTVIHYDTPDCLEYYYQEAGRAGRDGKKSYTVLLHSDEDLQSLEALPGIRFPQMQDIRKVYQSLADYLQIPAGSGQGNYYDFNLNDFARTFRTDIQLVVHVLKTLEQEEHLAFNENIFLPAKVMFACSKELIAEFETGHADLEPLIKALLRTYEGIYDNSVSINEKLLSKILRRKEDEIQTDLRRLEAFGIIEYVPQKETPQIYYMLNRAPANDLHINHHNYLQRKQQYEQRVHAMLQYIKSSTKCRSKTIANYFGDVQAKDCGICDNCLKKKKTGLTAEEFSRIEKKIFSHITDEGIEVKQLIQLCSGINKDKLWSVIEFLQSEDKIGINGAGIVRRKK